MGGLTKEAHYVMGLDYACVDKSHLKAGSLALAISED